MRLMEFPWMSWPQANLNFRKNVNDSASAFNWDPEIALNLTKTLSRLFSSKQYSVTETPLSHIEIENYAIILTSFEVKMFQKI